MSNKPAPVLAAVPPSLRAVVAVAALVASAADAAVSALVAWPATRALGTVPSRARLT
jgi:hypothetical protein